VLSLAIDTPGHAPQSHHPGSASSRCDLALHYTVDTQHSQNPSVMSAARKSAACPRRIAITMRLGEIGNILWEIRSLNGKRQSFPSEGCR
jgi:hypothetical protein